MKKESKGIEVKRERRKAEKRGKGENEDREGEQDKVQGKFFDQRALV